MDRGELMGWLTGVFPESVQETLFLPMMLALVLSLLSSLVVSLLYVRFFGSRATGSQIHRSFSLLGISITAIFIAIQFSLPLSLGLLGALSIVRFRTPIKEPEEIGFIMLVVAASLACATLSVTLLFLVLAIAVVALFVWRFKALRGRTGDGTFIVTLPVDEYRSHGEELLRSLEKLLPESRIDSIASSDGESVISVSFLRLSTDSLLRLQGELEKISGQASTNVFYNRPNGA